MKRKTSALLIIILANIVLLGHAVIPHHHHEDEICIVNYHCQNDGESHKHSSDMHKHHHDGENGFEDCVLKQFYVTPSSQIRWHVNSLERDHYNFQVDNYQAVIFDRTLIELYPVSVSYKLLVVIHTHSKYVSTILGSRAPPIV